MYFSQEAKKRGRIIASCNSVIAGMVGYLSVSYGKYGEIGMNDVADAIAVSAAMGLVVYYSIKGIDTAITEIKKRSLESKLL